MRCARAASRRASPARSPASSSIVGPIFPPSIPLIIYGTVTGVSVIQLLIGGILPALVCVAMLMLMTGWLAIRRKYPRADRWPTLAELWRDLKPALPAILAPVIFMAGMMAGFFTPTEIASITVVYALLISALFYRELTWQGLLDAAWETIGASCRHPADSRGRGAVRLDPVGRAGAAAADDLDAGDLHQSEPCCCCWSTCCCSMVGMFLDSTTAILVIAPIIAKPLVAAGVDPVHLGMVVVFNLMIGLLTPPMGLALFLVADIAKVSMKDVLLEMRRITCRSASRCC